MTRPARVSIDLAALKHNLQQVRRHAPEAKVMAVVKANAYGHGAIMVADTLASAGADSLAVACLEEALQLREAGLEVPILLLEGVFQPQELHQAISARLDLTVHSSQQMQMLADLAEAQRHQIGRVWLKVDTGMHRLGFAPLQAQEQISLLHSLFPANTELGLMTHLANAGNADDSFTPQQLQCFAELRAAFADMPVSIANSAAIQLWPDAAAHWVRPGLMLYGASSVSGRTGADLGLKPVMKATSKLIAIKDCRKGDSVGYNCAFVCPRDMRIGVVAFGYGDGYPRHIERDTSVWIGAAAAPLVGVVSMDMLTVDLSNHPDAMIDDVVELWGEHIPVEEVAMRTGTIPYELTCKITRRVQREYRQA